MTLYKIKNTKNSINNIIMQINSTFAKDIEILTMAIGWKLFEQLIYIGVIDDQNILSYAAATQLLAFKFFNQFDCGLKLKISSTSC